MRVALTGGIASGKSTVSAIFADLGAVVVDYDQIARDVVEPGSEGLAGVAAEFGAGVLAADGRLDRPALGAVVFADPERRRTLEAILHPLIRARGAALEAAAAPDALVLHDIPLLAESDSLGSASSFDAVVVVDVPEALQISRMEQDRGWSRADAEARIAAQASREQRLAIATYVIDNTGSLAALRARVLAIHGDLRARAGGDFPG